MGPIILNAVFLTNVCGKAKKKKILKYCTHRLCNLVYVLWSRCTCGISLRKAEVRRKTNGHWDHRRRLKKKMYTENYYIVSNNSISYLDKDRVVFLLTWNKKFGVPFNIISLPETKLKRSYFFLPNVEVEAINSSTLLGRGWWMKHV